MKRVKMMKKYAELIATIGIGANSNQDVCIDASVEMADFVHYLVLELYSHKVKNIDVNYSDPVLEKQRILHTTVKKLGHVDQLKVDRMKRQVERGCARISLVGTDPSAFSSISADKVNAYNGALRTATFPFRQVYNNNVLAWCIAGVPTRKWAVRVFPNVTPTQAVSNLWKAIYRSVRVNDEVDPIEAWNKHINTLRTNAHKLNQLHIKSLHYTNSLGTDLTIELPEEYRFCAASTVQSRYNTAFTPNLPTEEVFSSPLKKGVNGIVYSSRPLSHNGALINKFWLRFENGKVVDYGAEEGLEHLCKIIDFDEGSCYLGEVALVPYHSPISEMGILFYNTLYDENASCHLALGNSFNECVHNGESMSTDELEKIGLNQSREHVDFMVGTSDLSIVATDRDGHQVPVFVDGDFAI